MGRMRTVEYGGSRYGAGYGNEERLRRLLTDASHELRIPLTAIRDVAQLSRVGERVDTAKLMERIERESVRMGRILDQLLLHMRMDVDYPMEYQPIDLRALIEAIAGEARGAGGPGLQVEVHADKGCPEIRGDRIRLRLALSNLLAEVIGRSQPDSALVLRLVRIADRIRIEAAVAPATAGMRCDTTGPGLAVAQSIITAHGGVLWINGGRSVVGNFVVELPCER